jgi:hypothetical protein
MLHLTKDLFVVVPTGGLPMFGTAEPVVEVVSERLFEMFGLCACWFEAFPFDAQMPRIEPGRVVLPADEPGVAPWSFGGGVELPVRFDGLTLGRFVLVPVKSTTGVGFSPADRDAAISIAADAGAEIAEAILKETAAGRAQG